ncbi:hypothetical protein HDU67_002391, partial [Dinochytrium kinnereticum]
MDFMRHRSHGSPLETSPFDATDKPFAWPSSPTTSPTRTSPTTKTSSPKNPSSKQPLSTTTSSTHTLKKALTTTITSTALATAYPHAALILATVVRPLPTYSSSSPPRTEGVGVDVARRWIERAEKVRAKRVGECRELEGEIVAALVEEVGEGEGVEVVGGSKRGEEVGR